ncbi:MAG: methyltransferase [Chlamydiales bacterium]
MKRFCCRYLMTIVCLISCMIRLDASQSGVSYPSVTESSTEKGRENLLLLLSGEWVSRALYVVTKLEVADYLQDGPKSVQEIATSSQSNPESLRRILHMLVGFGIFEERDDGVFMNNEASALLAKSNPESLHALSIFYGEDIHSSWDQLLNSINTGTPAFQLTFKQPVFSYFKENPPRAALFQEAMREKSIAVIKSALSSYDFGQFGSIYDIGGGYGQFMSAILAQCPNANGMVFDVPEVIDSIPKRNPQIVSSRCQLCAGDFFASVPKGGDAYLLKSVLHDWDDTKAEQILKNCYLAMDSNSRLLIVEVVLLPKDQSVYANCMDVLMLAITGGKERTLASFEQMLDKSGFILERVYSTSTEFAILEARKKCGDI